MQLSSSLLADAAALLAAFLAVMAAPAPLAYAADATDRTAMPGFCSNRDVTCVLPDGPPPRLRARAVPAAGDPTIVITPPVGSTSTSAGGVGATPTVPSVPALPGQVPSLPGAVPTLSGQVPALPAQVPTLSGSPPALPGQVPTAITGATSTGTTSTSSTGTATGTGPNTGTSSAVTHGAASRR